MKKIYVKPIITAKYFSDAIKASGTPETASMLATDAAAIDLNEKLGGNAKRIAVFLSYSE